MTSPIPGTIPENISSNPRIFSPLSSFSLKDQKPTGSPLNPLHWGAWFSYQKSKLNLPNPGKFERLHSEAKGKYTFIYFNTVYNIVLFILKETKKKLIIIQIYFRVLFTYLSIYY